MTLYKDNLPFQECSGRKISETQLTNHLTGSHIKQPDRLYNRKSKGKRMRDGQEKCGIICEEGHKIM